MNLIAFRDKYRVLYFKCKRVQHSDANQLRINNFMALLFCIFDDKKYLR